MSFTAGGASINLARRVETPLDACCYGYQNRTKRIVKPSEVRSLKPTRRSPQKMPAQHVAPLPPVRNLTLSFSSCLHQTTRAHYC